MTTENDPYTANATMAQGPEAQVPPGQPSVERYVPGHVVYTMGDVAAAAAANDALQLAMNG